MAKVAKLVTLSLTVRVIVDESAEDTEIATKAHEKALNELRTQMGYLDMLENIQDDTEIPFGKGRDDVYYRPKIDDRGVVINHEYSKHGVLSCEVWREKSNLKKLFPKCIVEEFSGDDIGNKVFVD
jgi:hypothetical protein